MNFAAARRRRRPGRPPTRFKTYTVQRAGAQWERLLADVAAGCVVQITRRGRPVASVLAPDTLEMLEILASPVARKALRAAQAGRAKDHPLSARKG